MSPLRAGGQREFLQLGVAKASTRTWGIVDLDFGAISDQRCSSSGWAESAEKTWAMPVGGRACGHSCRLPPCPQTALGGVSLGGILGFLL